MNPDDDDYYESSKDPFKSFSPHSQASEEAERDAMPNSIMSESQLDSVAALMALKNLPPQVCSSLDNLEDNSIDNTSSPKEPLITVDYTSDTFAKIHKELIKVRNKSGTTTSTTTPPDAQSNATDRAAFNRFMQDYITTTINSDKRMCQQITQFLQRFTDHNPYRKENNTANELSPLLRNKLLTADIFSKYLPDLQQKMTTLRADLRTALLPFNDVISQCLDAELAEIYRVKENFIVKTTRDLRAYFTSQSKSYKITKEHAQFDISAKLGHYTNTMTLFVSPAVCAVCGISLPNVELNTTYSSKKTDMASLQPTRRHEPLIRQPANRSTNNVPEPRPTTQNPKRHPHPPQHENKPVPKKRGRSRSRGRSRDRSPKLPRNYSPSRKRNRSRSSSMTAPHNDGRCSQPLLSVPSFNQPQILQPQPSPLRKRDKRASFRRFSKRQSNVNKVSKKELRLKKFKELKKVNADKKIFFHNISSYRPSKNETKLLNLGLKCVLPPPPVTQDALNSSFDQLVRCVRLKYMFIDNPTPDARPFLRIPNHDFIPSPGPPAIECFLTELQNSFDDMIRSAKMRRSPLHLAKLRQSIISLRQNKTIVIKAADKNLGPVLMDASFYERLAYDILNDTNTYKKLEHPPPVTLLFARLRLILTKHSLLHSPEGKFFLQNEHDKTTKNAATFYILPKLHKTPVKGRPIVSCSGFVTYYASVWLDHILKPLVTKTKSFIQNSAEAVLYTVDYKFPRSCVLLSADVESLYPSIPIEDGLLALESTLTKEQLPRANIDFIIDIARWVLTNNYITFNGEYWLQLQGTAMGTPMAVVYANLFLASLEDKLFTNIKYSNLPYFKRYIDDIFAIVPSQELAESLVADYNELNKSINITHTIGKEAIFLDVAFSMPSEPKRQIPYVDYVHLTSRLYQKPMNRYIYIPPTSYHHPNTFTAFISAEIRRYTLLCSDIEDLNACKKQFFARLLLRGYSANYLNKVFATAQFDRDLLLNECERNINLRLKDTKIDTDEPRPFTLILDWTPLKLTFQKKLWKHLPDYVFNDLLAHTVFKQDRPFVISHKPSKNIGSLLIRSAYRKDT